MTYREAESADSIIVCMGKSLVALDHETGKIRSPRLAPFFRLRAMADGYVVFGMWNRAHGSWPAFRR